MEYNTQRSLLSISEYGRNVQKMIAFACTIQDRELRNKAAHTIVAIMTQLNNPQRMDPQELKQKIWDHLFIISDFKLDVDSPFPKPDPEHAEIKKYKCAYPTQSIRFRQYGKVMEKMIAQAIEMPEGEEKTALIKYIANHLKKLYLSWNRESVTDEVIFGHLETLSKGKIVLDTNTQLEQTRDLIAINNKLKNQSGMQQGHNQNNKFKKNIWRKKNKNK